MQHFQVKLIGPPVAVRPSAGIRGRGGRLRCRAVHVREGAFAAGAACIIFHGLIESYEGKGITISERNDVHQ